MSCPYFWPAARSLQSAAPRDAMLPLGDLWTGACHAVRGEPWQPDESRLRKLCNIGYARGICDRFPAAGDAPDAVRFTIAGHDAESIRIYYAIELDHHPFAHGPLEYSTAENRFASPLPEPSLARQAAAYIASYLRRKEA